MTRNVVAIVPAWNEAPRIATVLRTLIQSGRFARILVVDDGSTDGTAAEARRIGVDVLRMPQNSGKGAAMLAGLRATRAPVVAFIDADLVGLTPEHVRAMVDPVERGEFAMVAGLRDWGPTQNAVQGSLPIITGERAVRREYLERVPAELWDGFKIEVAINDTVARGGGRVGLVTFNGVQVVNKLEKFGAAQGLAKFVDMGSDIVGAMSDIAARNAPADAPPPATLAAKCNDVSCVLDEVTGSLVRSAAPVIQSDHAMQERIGAAAGREVANGLRPVGWTIAALLAWLIFRKA